MLRGFPLRNSSSRITVSVSEGRHTTVSYIVALSMLAGAALGAGAIQGLQAQGKGKAYVITELETLDAAAANAFTPVAGSAQAAGGGRSLRTAGGKVVSLEGAAAPSRVGLTEWDSIEQAQAFYKSKAWTDLSPQRDKAVKTIRRYVVEALNQLRTQRSKSAARGRTESRFCIWRAANDADGKNCRRR